MGCSQVSDGQCVILAYKAFLGILASGGFDDRLRPHLQCCKEQSAKPGKEGGEIGAVVVWPNYTVRGKLFSWSPYTQDQGSRTFLAKFTRAERLIPSGPQTR